jgi:hypothetical protein
MRDDAFNENRACAVRGFAVAAAKADSIVELRKQPGPPGGRPVPANLLNHADDQTVVAVSAVLNAIGESGLDTQSFEDWGVVAAPRFPGRISFATSIEKFSRLGPLSVSPVIIPFLSLHATASAISLALHIHGPAVGAGGGNDGFAGALLVALALQQEKDVPGVWLVVTAWDPEPIPDKKAAPEAEPVCRAVALALAPAAAGASHDSWLRMVPGGSDSPVSPLEFIELFQFLADRTTAGRPRTRGFALPGGYALELAVGSVHSAVHGLTKSA